MTALCNTAGHYIFALWFLSFFLLLSSFFLALSQRSEIGCLPYFHTWCGLSANLECRSDMCCMRLTENTGCKKIAIWAPSHKFVGLYLCNWHVSTIGKKLVKQQYLLHMSPQYGQLRPTSGWDHFLSLGYPVNFNGFRVLAALLHGNPVVGVRNFAALNRGRHLYSAGGYHVGYWPTFLVCIVL